ncbi:MAG TPA: hypothetical protein VGN57_12550 [Pirellulaceae bacterium]|jgi:hypothetical protein|nr:hypothetical protein [Pirellulaceae bacterium]
MSEFFIGYEKIAPATWVYLSSLLMLALYFKFSRYWSLRNLDLILLIAVAPGLLFYHWGSQLQIDALRQAATASAVQPGPGPSADSAAGAIGADPASRLDEGTAEDADEPASAESATAFEEREDLPGSRRDRGRAALTSPVVPSAVELTNEPEPVSADGATLEISVDDDSYETAVAGPEEESRRMLGRSRTLLTVAYIWLFAATAVYFIRLIIDPLMVRRPLLEPNLSPGGLIFLGCSLFVFLMANVVTSPPSEDDLQGPKLASKLFQREATEKQEEPLKFGPGLAVVYLLPTLPTYPTEAENDPNSPTQSYQAHAVASRIMAILAHLAIVAGLVVIGWRHFNNPTTSVGMAALYLMLPYTAIMTGRVIHFLPAAMLVWAFVFYRRPMLAGVFLGAAIGTVYYPLFLLPLWISFYRQRGWAKFVIGIAISLGTIIFSLIFTSADFEDFVWQLRRMFGLWAPQLEGLEGFWDLVLAPAYRISALTAFVAISGALALWPTQKNLGTLISCSALLMTAVQFWHGFGGGTYIAWYLPLLILTFFRPNLEDRVAISVIRAPRAAAKRVVGADTQMAA